MMVGGRMKRNAIDLIMTRKIPERITKKPRKKTVKGAKSRTQKGRILKTDSSQPGIGQFLFHKKTLIGSIDMDLGIGRLNSLGSSKKTT